MSGSSKEKKLVSINPSKSLPEVTNDSMVSDKPSVGRSMPSISEKS